MARPNGHAPEMHPAVCAVCGEHATRLCDFPIGWLSDERRTTAPASSWMYRCDVPLCDTHAERNGNGVWSRELAEVGIDGVDLCPHCVRLSERGLRRTPIDLERIARYRHTARLWCERGGTWRVIEGGRK